VCAQSLHAAEYMNDEVLKEHGVMSTSIRCTAIARMFSDTERHLQHQVAMMLREDTPVVVAPGSDDDELMACAAPTEDDTFEEEPVAVSNASTKKRSSSDASQSQGGRQTKNTKKSPKVIESDVDEEDERSERDSDDDTDEDRTKAGASLTIVKKVGRGDVMVVGMECYERFDHAYFASRYKTLTGGFTSQAQAKTHTSPSVKAAAVGAKAPPPVVVAKGKAGKKAPGKGIGKEED
jgi:hypothetical protein